MSSPAQAQGVQAPAIPLSSQIATALGFFLPLILGALGVTDTHLPALLREEVPPFLAFISCAVALGHHSTLQEWLRTVASLGTVAATASTELAGPVTPVGLPVVSSGVPVGSAEAVQAAAAIAGRIIEANRQGILATAPTGRHLALDGSAVPAGVFSDETPTAVFPAVPAQDTTPYPPPPPAVSAAGALSTPGV